MFRKSPPRPKSAETTIILPNFVSQLESYWLLLTHNAIPQWFRGPCNEIFPIQMEIAYFLTNLKRN